MVEIPRRPLLATSGATGLGLLAGCVGERLANGLGSGEKSHGNGLYYPAPTESETDLLGSRTRIGVGKPSKVRSAYPDHRGSFPFLYPFKMWQEGERFAIPMENERRLVALKDKITCSAFECDYDRQRTIENVRGQFGSIIAIDESYDDFQIIGMSEPSGESEFMALGPDSGGWIHFSSSTDEHDFRDMNDCVRSVIDTARGDLRSGVRSKESLGQFVESGGMELGAAIYLGLGRGVFESSAVGISQNDSSRVYIKLYTYFSEEADPSEAEVREYFSKWIPSQTLSSQGVDLESLPISKNDRLATIKIPFAVEHLSELNFGL